MDPDFRRAKKNVGGELRILSMGLCLFNLTCKSNHKALTAQAIGQATKMSISNQMMELQQRASEFPMTM